MRFLDPVYLWGLLAIALPIVLHLFLRRRVPVLDFPLTRLVLRAEHSRQPRKKLNRLLLLLARAAILALLALALSRVTFGGTRVVAQGPVSAVVVVDDSLSMQATAQDGGTLFARGIEMADSLLAALPDGSEISVIAMSLAVGGTAGSDTHPFEDAAQARARLARIEPTLRHVVAGPALSEATALLAKSRRGDRRLVLVSDLARHGFSDLALPRWGDLATKGARPRLHVLSPRREDGPNLSVSGIDAAPLPGGRLAVSARVAGWGLDKPRDVALELRTGALGGELRVAGRGRVSAGLGASEERRFEIAAPPTGFGESVVSLPHDVLAADDERHAVHHVAMRPRVLVVDGDPQNLAIGSESFYVEKALAPGVGLEFDADIVPLAELGASQIEGRAAILLCNVPELSDERVRALEAAVRAGTGLVVSLGNRVDVTSYDGRMAGLLPARIGLPREFRPPATIVPDASPAATSPGAAAMPPLPRVAVHSAMILEPRDDAHVALRLSDGSPLLVEGHLGSGSVVMFATTLDRDWTDLPISPFFLQFLRALIDRAAPQGAAVVLPSVSVGAPVDLRALGLSSAATLRGPDGLKVPIPSGIFEATTKPGAWLVEDGGPRAAFAVVTDPMESDLSRLSNEEVAAAVKGSLDPGGVVEGGPTESGGVPAWKGLLLALVAACALEAWLARRAA